MKFIIKFSVFLFVLVCCVTGQARSQDIVRLTNGDWPPFMSGRLKHGGFFTHIVTKALAIEGIDVEYEYLPWKRAIILARNGEMDGSVGWSFTKDRAPFFFYSDPVLISSEVFFHLKSFPFDWKHIEDLKGLKIGGGIGYFYGDPFEKAEKKGIITISRIKTDEQNFKKLLSHRLDLVLVNLYVGFDLLNSRFEKNERLKITYHPRPVREGKWHLILSNKIGKNKKRIQAFNAGLAKLKASGEFNRLLSMALRGEYRKK